MRKVGFWIFLLLVFSVAGIDAKETKQVSVLCYHTFLGKPKIATDFSLEEFKQHIQTLKANHAHFITWEQFKKGQYSGTKNILIVIDDGNISGYKAYKTVLKPQGIYPVFAIYPNIINRVFYAMTWDQLKEVLKDPCAVASHGFYHLYLNESFAKKDESGFNREIVISKQILESNLGIQVEAFVYPFGVLCTTAKNLIRKTGYSYAFSLKATPTESTDDHFDSPRYMLTRPMARAIIRRVSS